MSCANNVLPVYMWPSPEKIPEGLCLRPVQVDTVHFSPEATETNGFSCVSSSLNRTAVKPGSGVGSLGPLFITSVGIGGLGLNNGHLFVRGVNTSPDGHVQFIIEAEGLHIPASSGDVSFDWNWYQGVNTSFHFLVVAWDATEGTAGFSHPGTEGPFPKIP